MLVRPDRVAVSSTSVVAVPSDVTLVRPEMALSISIAIVPRPVVEVKPVRVALSSIRADREPNDVVLVRPESEAVSSIWMVTPPKLVALGTPVRLTESSI